MDESSGLQRKSCDDGVYVKQRSIWSQKDLNIYEKMVWMCLEKYANGNLPAWPSRSTLAKECSISIAQVKKTINSLIEKGLIGRRIRKNEGNFQTNLYSLFHPNLRNKQASYINYTKDEKK